ncbi:hypothetical protein [Chryseobacterium oryctis]|uniref:GLPGLI family protein n=1 Tax=Chryseobacterium oryctis TaxID=2952618 RepID=A0ABT3HKP4_9FLAO|nr:hypothetical protein [Chryseobacterium oryctis]MCW3160359.1 hypothetical protein [Chryseobacterium oryctis]
MKIRFNILITLLISYTSFYAQEISIDENGNTIITTHCRKRPIKDTLNYVKQFEINKINYIGQPFSKLLNEMTQIQPKTAWAASMGRKKIISCKAQQIYPLLTSVGNVPNLSHLKDTNNELQSFVGTYAATYNGNQITLYITKEDEKLFNTRGKQIYRDVLEIKYVVKNSTGTVLQDTKNLVLPDESLKYRIYSLWVTENGNKAELIYNGTNCNVGFGSIDLKKLNATQLSWEYKPNDIVTTADKCPPNFGHNHLFTRDKGFNFY